MDLIGEVGKMSNKTKLDAVLIERILLSIRQGAFIETAAAFAGVSKQSLYNWMKRGAREQQRVKKNPHCRVKKEEAIYVEFVEKIELAMATAELLDIAKINKAAKNDWKAAAWKLERKYPKRWGRRIQFAGDKEEPLVVQTWADVVKNLSEREKREADSDNGESIEGCTE